MKLVLKYLVLLIFSFFMPINSFSYDVEIEGIGYNLDTNAKTAEVTQKAYSGVINIPSSVSYNGVIYTVQSIGSSAFSNCSGLTSIIIPSSITSIGNASFYYCSDLTSIVIPTSVKSIGSSAFSGCSGLTSLTIPNSVTSIDDFTFNRCI